MSGRTWLYADPHFYHDNICRFTNYDGSKVRPWDDANEMTEDLIKMYNEVVDDGDRVYILGDVAFSTSKMRSSVSRLKGRKVLVKGNHDPDGKKEMYNELFDDVRACVVKKGFILTHIPIHPQSLSRWVVNIHGHLHSNSIMLDGTPGIRDDRYDCVSVEQTDFKPILLDVVLERHGLKNNS